MKSQFSANPALQGQAAVADLVANSGVEEVICVEHRGGQRRQLTGLADLNRVRFVQAKGRPTSCSPTSCAASTRSSISCHCR